jgi:hypothetical protein
VRREGQGPISATFSTATVAKAWGRKIESDIDTGKHFGHSRIKTLADAMDAFTAKKATIKTANDRNRHLDWWREHYGHRKLFHFTSDVVDAGRGTGRAIVLARETDRGARARRGRLLMSAPRKRKRRRERSQQRRQPLCPVGPRLWWFCALTPPQAELIRGISAYRSRTRVSGSFFV